MRIPARVAAVGSSATPKAIATKGPALGVEHTGDRQTQELQRKLADATARARQDPGSNKTVLVGITFGAGQAQVLNHGLGDTYTGWLVVRALVNPASFVEVALPQGADPKKQIALQSANAGIYDIEVRSG